MAKRKAEDFVGARFTRLVVARVLDTKTKDGHKEVLCTCDCGANKTTTINNLNQGTVKSCGCLRRETASKASIKAFTEGVRSGRIVDPVLGSAKKVYRRYSDGDLTLQDFLRLSQEDCFYCGTSPQNSSNCYAVKKSRYSSSRQANGTFKYNGLDRVDNSRPHDLNNVVTCCITCNKAKLTQTKEDFFSWVRAVYNKHCI